MTQDDSLIYVDTSVQTVHAGPILKTVSAQSIDSFLLYKNIVTDNSLCNIIKNVVSTQTIVTCIEKLG